MVGYERISFGNARERDDAPTVDGVEIVSFYDGPHGPAWVGFTADDRATAITGDGVGTWRFEWGPAMSFMEPADRELAIAGFGATGAGQLTLRWRHRYRRSANAVEAVGEGGRWIIRTAFRC